MTHSEGTTLAADKPRISVFERQESIFGDTHVGFFWKVRWPAGAVWANWSDSPKTTRDTAYAAAYAAVEKELSRRFNSMHPRTANRTGLSKR